MAPCGWLLEQTKGLVQPAVADGLEEPVERRVAEEAHHAHVAHDPGTAEADADLVLQHLAGVVHGLPPVVDGGLAVLGVEEAEALAGGQRRRRRPGAEEPVGHRSRDRVAVLEVHLPVLDERQQSLACPASVHG